MNWYFIGHKYENILDVLIEARDLLVFYDGFYLYSSIYLFDFFILN